MNGHDFYRLEDGYHFSNTFIVYCRSHAVEKFREDLKTMGIDPKEVQVVHTHSRRLDGGKHEIRFFYKISKGNLDRPNCPECGSDKIISKGMSWYCKTCGRWFIKKRRLQRNNRNL